MGGEVILLLGSNTGRRVRSLRDGIAALSGGMEVERVSRIFVGEPGGRAHQPWYLNVAVRGTTSLSPESLLRFVKSIEAAAGRKSGPRWGPRELDIDIILMGNTIVREEHLVIPHPRMAMRRFCLAPVHDIAPDVPIPPDGRMVKDLFEDCRDPLEVTPL